MTRRDGMRNASFEQQGNRKPIKIDQMEKELDELQKQADELQGTINALKISLANSEGAIEALNKNCSKDGHTHEYSALLKLPTEFPPTSHTHDSNYYTKVQMNESFKNGTVTAIGVSDTRDTNETPQWYMKNHGKSLCVEFKSRSAISFPGTGSFVPIITIVPWHDSSGGYPVQLGFNGTTMYTRIGIETAVWSAWTVH